jgi:hypothetical protein
VEGAKAAVPFVVVTLTLSACGNRLPLSDRELTDVIRNAQEFSPTTDCSEGVKGRRELLSVADASMVTCESSIDECRCFTRLRWRWRTESTKYGVPGRRNGKLWEAVENFEEALAFNDFSAGSTSARKRTGTPTLTRGALVVVKRAFTGRRGTHECVRYGIGGRRRCQSVRAWKSRPMASSVFSVNGRPTS